MPFSDTPTRCGLRGRYYSKTDDPIPLKVSHYSENCGRGPLGRSPITPLCDRAVCDCRPQRSRILPGDQCFDPDLQRGRQEQSARRQIHSHYADSSRSCRDPALSRGRSCSQPRSWCATCSLTLLFHGAICVGCSLPVSERHDSRFFRSTGTRACVPSGAALRYCTGHEVGCPSRATNSIRDKVATIMSDWLLRESTQGATAAPAVIAQSALRQVAITAPRP
jgi:hypothetical protein